MSDHPTDPQHGPTPPSGGEGRQAPQQPAGAPPAGQSPYAPPPGGYPQPGYGGYPPQQGGYPHQGQPGQPGYGPGYGQQAQPSALGGLTDLSFTRRITPALAKVVYAAVLVLALIVAVEGVVSAVHYFSLAGDRFSGGPGYIFDGLLELIKGPVAGFVLLAFARFALEYLLDRATAARGA